MFGSFLSCYFFLLVVKKDTDRERQRFVMRLSKERQKKIMNVCFFQLFFLLFVFLQEKTPMKESLVTLFERRILLIVKSSIFFKLLVHTVKKYSACVLSCIFACVNWGHAVPLPNQSTRFEFQDFFFICVANGGIFISFFEDDTP